MRETINARNGRDVRACSTGSINFRINASAFAGMLLAFILLDLVILAFDLVPQHFEYVFPLAFRLRGSWQDVLDSLIALGLSGRYIVISVVEILLLVLKVVLGTRSVAHKLEPVEALSNMAMELNEQSGAFDEERLHALEDAIEHMDADGGALNTGDKELAGLELAVNQLVRRMRDSYMQQARFVSDASHELRTPIAVIKGYADMLDRWGKQDPKILDESVEAIKSESERMSYLVEQLLFLARGDCGKTKLKLEEFDLMEMMKEVCEESRMIDEKNHTYVLKCGSALKTSASRGDYSAGKLSVADGEGSDLLPVVSVVGDRTLLKQTARILIDNAAKYTPDGERITLSAGMLEDGTSKDGPSGAGSAFFRVQDNGIGIAQSALPYLFDRFYRADDSRAKNTGGTGLGLAIAKWIIDRHGGSFDVLSREGIGTRITVVLPK